MMIPFTPAAQGSLPSGFSIARTGDGGRGCGLAHAGLQPPYHGKVLAIM